MSLEIQIMNKPGRQIQRSIVSAYDRYPNTYIHNENAIIIDRRYYIRDIWLNMLNNFLDRDSEYLLMLQDDVMLGKNFREAIEFIVHEGLNTSLINLFNNYNMNQYKIGFLHSNFQRKYLDMFRGQGHILDRSCAEALTRKDMIDMFDIRHSDGYTVHVLHHLNIPYAYTNPSFLGHDKTMKSTIMNPGSGRPHSFPNSKTYKKNFDLLEFTKEYYK